MTANTIKITSPAKYFTGKKSKAAYWKEKAYSEIKPAGILKDRSNDLLYMT